MLQKVVWRHQVVTEAAEDREAPIPTQGWISGDLNAGELSQVELYQKHQEEERPLILGEGARGRALGKPRQKPMTRVEPTTQEVHGLALAVASRFFAPQFASSEGS